MRASLPSEPSMPPAGQPSEPEPVAQIMPVPNAPAPESAPPADPHRSWLCIHLPRLALDLIERRQSPSAGNITPSGCVVIDGPEQRAQVHLADIAAQALGVRAGQRLAAAQALAPDLLLQRREPQAERQALEHLAAWAYRYTSRVSLDGNAALLLEIAASMRLFGGFDALYTLLQSELQQLGFSGVFGLGLTPSAARLRAHVICHRPERSGQIFALASLPLTESELDSRTIATLAATGIHTLGELARLPRSGLARRFGQETLDYLAGLRGELPETLVCYRPPDRYHAWLELPAACTSTEALAFPLRRMLGDLCAVLAARDGGVENFTLRFALEALQASCELRSGIGDICRLEVGLLQASRDREHLYLLTRARLERMSFPRPVLGIYLEVARLPTFVPTHQDLFEDAQATSNSLKPLIERLSARLGEDALLRPQWIGDHRPERASRWCPYAQGALIRTPVGEVPGVRPLWLLPAPIALAIEGLALISSAERIESGWWDDGDIRRDYYIAEVIDPYACALASPHPGIAQESPPYARASRDSAPKPSPGFQLSRGARAWVFQDLRQPERWYLQGWFG